MWRPDPEAGIAVAGGFDGSENDDITGIRLETHAGYMFTPRYGPDRRPTVWNPREWGGRIPRGEVRAAWAELTDRYRSFDSSSEGDRRANVLEETIGNLRRDARWAIRDLLGLPRSTVELI